MAQVLEAHEQKIERIGLIPSDGGRFEVEVNGDLIYSKLETGRHLEDQELVGLVADYLREHP